MRWSMHTWPVQDAKATVDVLRWLIGIGAGLVQQTVRSWLRTGTHMEVTGAARFCRVASALTAGLDYLCLSNASSARPMSLAI